MAECLKKYGVNIPQPLNGYVIVHGLEKALTDDGGLMLSTKKEIKPTHGTVVAIDPSKLNDVSDVVAGDVVSFMIMGNGKEMIEHVNGLKCHLIPTDQLTAVHR